MKKVAAPKKISQKSIDKDIEELKRFVKSKIEKVDAAYHIIKEYGNYLLVSKLVTLNIHITNNTPVFQPFSIDRKIPYPIITLVEICSDIGEVNLPEEDGREVKKLMSKGVKVLKIYPHTVVMKQLDSIGTPPLS